MHNDRPMQRNFVFLYDWRYLLFQFQALDSLMTIADIFPCGIGHKNIPAHRKAVFYTHCNFWVQMKCNTISMPQYKENLMTCSGSVYNVQKSCFLLAQWIMNQLT